MDIKNDFGFTADPVAEVAITSEAMKKKFRELEEIILPVLHHLIETSEHDIIRWPNREQQIRQMIEKILSITRSL